ncbi:MAG: HAD hydrolase-like protein, partial [Patescibacteria group bacterium]|nr:HAD hydrolase-like protein [Patescibacteria group bacterium]
MKTKIKAFILDMDGMIVHGERFSKRLANTFGISLEITSPFFKGPFQECLVGNADLKFELQKILPEWGWKGTVDELIAFWFSPEATLIHSGFELVASALRARGIHCYLATNNEQYRTSHLMKERGLSEWFDGVFSSANLGCKKPEPAFFEMVLAQIPFTKDEIMFWDDDQENVDGARTAG